MSAKNGEALWWMPCPNGCPHPSGMHGEYQPTWEKGEDGPVRVDHPKYRPLLFACAADGCGCEIDESVSR